MKTDIAIRSLAYQYNWCQDACSSEPAAHRPALGEQSKRHQETIGNEMNVPAYREE